ncbi:MAG: hypothetical protein HFI41_16190 [Lachnospiraceae bacterium]|nr:hypothetical protein [Lachnospiraceae bacterium]
MLFELITMGKFCTELYTVQKVELEEAEKKIIQMSRGELDVARVLLMPNGEI